MAHDGPSQELQVTPSADLALLVATERELEAQLAAAQERARTTVESAYTEAGARSSAQEQELTQARQQFQAEIEEERSRRTKEVLAEGERQSAWFDAMPERRIAELAGIVVARLLGAEAR
jgi:vacuolar-type H+-ATPase subunit H